MTINAGSSSVKLVLFTDKLARLVDTSVTDIGQANSKLSVSNPAGETSARIVDAKNHEQALTAILDTIADQLSDNHLLAIGHRVVHGGQRFDTPVVVNSDVVDYLKTATPSDPEHMKSIINLLETLRRYFPQVRQVACFDTAFYRELPTIARLLPLPRKYESLGLRRYGFHGLSYDYLIEHFRDIAGETAAQGRILLAHLGSGASLTAVKNGKPLDTTMSFTPSSGIPMSSRSGDLDPGIIAFLHQQTGMTIEEFNHLVHFESGLLGLSGMSADMEFLVSQSAQQQSAAEAIDLFCYQIRKTIGGFAAVLGGLDSLIFSGGIGENSAVIRAQICQGLDYLGISLDEQRNQNHEFLIAREDSRVGVHVMHTDEAVVIARQTQQLVIKEIT